MRLAAGQPTLPYPQEVLQANSTFKIDITSLDFDNELEAPESMTYRIDDLTNLVSVLPETNVPTPGETTTLTITAAQNAMTRNFQDQQMNQVVITAVYADGSQTQAVVPYQLNAVYGVSGVSP